jgi:hypothetical protein
MVRIPDRYFIKSEPVFTSRALPGSVKGDSRDIHLFATRLAALSERTCCTHSAPITSARGQDGGGGVGWHGAVSIGGRGWPSGEVAGGIGGRGCQACGSMAIA